MRRLRNITNHPVCAFKGTGSFLDGADTPPCEGGEYACFEAACFYLVDASSLLMPFGRRGKSRFSCSIIPSEPPEEANNERRAIISTDHYREWLSLNTVMAMLTFSRKETRYDTNSGYDSHRIDL